MARTGSCNILYPIVTVKFRDVSKTKMSKHGKMYRANRIKIVADDNWVPINIILGNHDIYDDD